MIEKLNAFKVNAKYRLIAVQAKINEIIDWINSIDPVHYIVKSPESTSRKQLQHDTAGKDTRKGCGKISCAFHPNISPLHLPYVCGIFQLCEDCKVKE